MNRQLLPTRRAAIRYPVRHDGQNYTVTVGFFADGRPGELFLDAEKQNSALSTHAADAAVLCSLLLQTGMTPAQIRHSITGPIGVALDLLEEGVG